MFRLSAAKSGKLAALLCVCAFIAAGSFFIPKHLEDRRSEAEEERDEPLEALMQEFQKTRDPKLNTVPKERLIKALNYYAVQTAMATKMKTTTPFSSITWSERGPNNIGGRTRAILFDNNDATHKAVFAASVGGGLWKCTDITATTPAWAVVNDQFANLAITSLAQDPGNAQTIYFGTGEGWGNADGIKGNGIWKSTNGGTTWTQLTATANNNDFAFVQKIIVTSTGAVYVACRGAYSNTGGLQKSTDGGATWTRVIGNGSNDMNIADIEEASNGDLYASAGIFTTGKILKSSSATYGANVGNSGNWADITPTGTWQRIELAVAPSSSGQIYAVCQGSANEVTGIYSSTNGGSTWTSKTVPNIYDQGANSVFTRGQSWYDLTCAVDPTTSTTLYIGGVDILKSTNSGSTWTQLTTWSLYDDGSFWPNPFPWSFSQNVHADVHALVFKPGASGTALVGCDGGLFYSTDLTNTLALPVWDSKSANYNVTQYYACATHPTDPNIFLAGAQDNGSHQFTTTGINTVTEVTGGDGAFCFIDKTNGNNMITSYVRNNYYFSNNGGFSFNDVNGYDNSGRFINPADLDNTNDILYSAGTTDQLVRWSSVFSFGASRSDLPVGLDGDQISAIKVSPNTPSTVYVGTDDGNVYRITNANATPTVTKLTSTQLVSGGYISSIDVVKRTTNTDDSILVSISNYGVNSVFYTANGTAISPTWVNIDDNSTLQDVPVRWAMWSPANSRIIFLATEVGVMGTGTLNGSSTVWTLLNNGNLPNVRVDMLQVNSSNQLVAATHGRGLWTSNNVTPLALQLLSFDARLTQDNVQMEWRVNNDNEAKMYSIERSYMTTPFEVIYQTHPLGSSVYTASDGAFNPEMGEANYRLKIEDVKGGVQYSAIRTIHFDGKTRFVEQIYPTVTSGPVTIKIGDAKEDKMRIQLIDVMGKVYMNDLMPYNTTSIDLRRFSSGSYLLYITNESGTQKYFSRVVIK